MDGHKGKTVIKQKIWQNPKNNNNNNKQREPSHQDRIAGKNPQHLHKVNK